MTKAVSGLMGGQPKPDTSALEAQRKALADQEARQAKLEDEQERKKKSSARARTGRSTGSLLTGLETGVEPTESGRRTMLG